MASEQLLDPQVGPEETFLATEQMRQIGEVIGSLSQEQAEVVRLRFIAELRYSEIARLIGKRESAVKMIAYRAIDEIRRRYTIV